MIHGKSFFTKKFSFRTCSFQGSQIKAVWLFPGIKGNRYRTSAKFPVYSTAFSVPFFQLHLFKIFLYIQPQWRYQLQQIIVRIGKIDGGMGMRIII
ncbi:hypothetical protein ACM6L3_19350 [Paenibacillus larvae]